MKQDFWKFLVYFVLVCIVIMVVFAGWTLVRSANSNDEIWTIANELNQQRDAKQECLDNLNYEESRQSVLWFTKPCVQYDERIMELKAELDSYLVKDYMKPAGLVESRQAQQ